MDFERWKLFLKVAEMGSLSKVAVVMKRRQPVISRHINALEIECGCTLFYRTGRGVALTEVGEAILPRVQTMVRESEQIMMDIKGQAGVPVGAVSVGLLPSVRIAADFLGLAMDKFPQVTLHLTEAAAGQLAEQVATGRIDLALVLREPGSLGLTDEALLTMPLCVVGPPGDPITSQRAVSLAQIAGLPLIQAKPPNALRLHIEQSARRAGVQLTYGPQIDALATQKQVIAGGMGYTITTRMAVREEVAQGLLSAADITEPRMDLMLVLVRSNQRPATLAIRKIARLLAELVRKLPDAYIDDSSPSFLPLTIQ
ncbi:LysR family transcriptional regulator [Novosphingobium rosa]|uniref:LysR family transcriptional regulator n=1 Tax=Novosphingobium rosa TaxID=76978 RepID=UPI00082EDEE1|nr:LysR family transcriptional regulator [Novosphingobium rosa]